MKQTSPYVEIKQVTWSKDSHGLFDYESKNVNYTKAKVDTAARVYKEGNGISIRSSTKTRSLTDDLLNRESNHLFSIATGLGEKNETFSIQADKKQACDDSDKLFLIVRSLKNEEGVQQGYNLELGDIIRLGRIEYRVIEYKDHMKNVDSLLIGTPKNMESLPFSLAVKDCNGPSENKKQCRICLMDESDTPEPLVNPCNCKGTSEYVHIQCLQDWISSKLKKKVNAETTCFYWKKLLCEVCKISLPDLVDISGQRQELIPVQRPEGPYLLLERVFYDKSKESADNSKTFVLLSLSGESQTIKIGRGHECDLRENDISVSRLHAYIKYQDGHFTILDNNSKFGTLIFLRKDLPIEKKKKLALQLGRTVITFSLKQTTVNNVPVFKNQTFQEKLTKWQSPKSVANLQVKPDQSNYTKIADLRLSPQNETQREVNLNGSFNDL